MGMDYILRDFDKKNEIPKAEMDFLEREKAFKDKIAKLEKDIENYKQSFDYKCSDYDFVSELLGKYQQENEALEKRIAELEEELDKSENVVSSEIDTSNPLACAESLIEHMTHCEKFMIMPERDVQTFSVEELKEIADYLMVYYRHHRYRDAEETISF